MKMGKNIIQNRLFALLFLVITGMLVANKGIFMHAHKLEDGTVIFHSHPYNKSNDASPVKTHHHSKAEFCFFHNTEILFFLTFLAVTLFLLPEKRKFITHFHLIFTPAYIHFKKSRAPPVFLAYNP